MTERIQYEDDGLLPVDFDLSQIFIGREQQLELFRIYLERWQKLTVTTTNTQLLTPPSPNDKIQGLVVLLHGRGGFGKSTLLKRYREIALEYSQELTVSKIVDWEFAAQDKLTLFNPAPGEKVDASAYFNLLRNQLAIALDKDTDAFKEYLLAVKAVEEARKRANDLLNNLQQDSRYKWLSIVAGEGLLTLLRSAGTGLPLPFNVAANTLLNNERIAQTVKEITDEGVKIGVEQVKQVREKLHDRLGTYLADFLDPGLRLARGLGRDLELFARRLPVLIFFDTYEEVDEADSLLRLVMGAAGAHVGWVLSGRDNLWAGLSQRLRSLETEYGYKDIVSLNRSMAVDFSADGVGDFTLSDIQEYFRKLSQLLRQPNLPVVTEKDAAHIQRVTQGVPLAVKIAASLYLEKPDLESLTEGVDSKREIVDQMVRRYLLHTRTNQAERAHLFGLALLRQAEQPTAIAAALGVSPQTSYEAELSRLHRRYGFIFTKHEQPLLHQEVRYFLRIWLLEHRTEPGIVAINQRLKDVHLTNLKELEEHRRYTTLRERLEDEQWVGIYLDLTEQQLWLDTAQGVEYALPFMLAAGVYRRDANREVTKIGKFFEPTIIQPYHRYWEWAAQSLIYSTSHKPFPEELTGLEELLKLASRSVIAFSPPLPEYQEALEAMLWWRLGEAYQGKNDIRALEWYEKALSRLEDEIELREATNEVARGIAYRLEEEQKNDEENNAEALLNEHEQSLVKFNHALELNPYDAQTYVYRGSVHAELNKYQQALADFDRALELNPKLAGAYTNRGDVYRLLKEYQHALHNLNRALELNPHDARTYVYRGRVRSELNEYQQALADFDRALELDSKSAWAYTGRGIAYSNLKEFERAILDFDRALELDPNLALARNSRAEAYRLKDFNRELQLNSEADHVNSASNVVNLAESEQVREIASSDSLVVSTVPSNMKTGINIYRLAKHWTNFISMLVSIVLISIITVLIGINQVQQSSPLLSFLKELSG